MEKFTPLQKFYTAAGSDGSDKFHLCHYHHHLLYYRFSDGGERTNSKAGWNSTLGEGGAC